MTWIYPKPRTLSRLSVFPVPFVSADKLFGEEENLDHGGDIVSCTLEYWDQCLKSFRAYSTFFLSEQELCHLDLPLLTDRKKLAVSDVWRIVIHGHNINDRNVVKPQSLVSVIRVDSFYSPLLIPKLQVSLFISSGTLLGIRSKGAKVISFDAPSSDWIDLYFFVDTSRLSISETLLSMFIKYVNCTVSPCLLLSADQVHNFYEPSLSFIYISIFFHRFHKIQLARVDWKTFQSCSY